MAKKLSAFRVGLVVILLSVLLTACSSATNTPAPVATTAAAPAATTAASGGATAATTAAAPAAGAGLSSADEAALYEAAKKEGKLVWYTVWFNQDIVNDIGAAFTAKYPGIKVEGTRNVAATIYQKLTQELQAGIKTTDVFGTTDIGQIMELKDQKQLVQYNAPAKEAILPQYRNLDPENFYQTGAVIPLVIGYNSSKIKAEELPKSWQDFTKPEFKDKLSTGSGAASGQIGTWALAMQQKYGWDTYFNALNKNNPKLGRSINDSVVDLVSGERSVGLVPLGQILTQKNKGNPVDAIYPSDGTVVVVGPVGIMKHTERPNASKLFMNFLASKEYAELLAKYYEQPFRSDVTVKGAKPLAEMQAVTPKPEEIRKELPEIIKKWRTLFGN